ncbi:hypothetical protein L7F22_066732 [Adiantum nelumboides]|nr:hypothetical protein [Adiantum nelumboides]
MSCASSLAHGQRQCIVVALCGAVVLVCMLQMHGASAQLGFNAEVDALIVFKNGLQDPQGVLASWDPSSADPCTWFVLQLSFQKQLARLHPP